MPDGWTHNHDRGREEIESAMFFNSDFIRARTLSHPFPSSFSGNDDSRSFPRVQSSCHVNASFSSGLFVRSFVCTLHLLPCLHPFRGPRRCMCVEQGFFGVDSWTCPSLLSSGSVRFRSFRWFRARHGRRSTARTDPLEDALLRNSRKNPIVRVSRVAFLFSAVLPVASFHVGVAVLRGARCLRDGQGRTSASRARRSRAERCRVVHVRSRARDEAPPSGVWISNAPLLGSNPTRAPHATRGFLPPAW
mmetsp:Transcript_10389/g.63390  ORF Transcript_10389/g.63390 Transcript_10389/m.63390 type:complete len:248 (-) Transcript_10389:42-785(-)